MPSRDKQSLRREIESMPSFVEDALRDRGLMDVYHERPPYQQNDYLIWINQAKRDETARRRMDQMLDELEQGDVYMKMEWRPGISKG